MPSSVKTSAKRTLYAIWRWFIGSVLTAPGDDFEKKRCCEQGRRIGFGFLELAADRFAPILRHPAQLAEPEEVDLDEARRPLPDVALGRNGQDARMRFHHFQTGFAKKLRELDRNIRFAARSAPAFHHLFGECFHRRTPRREPECFVVTVFMKDRLAPGRSAPAMFLTSFSGEETNEATQRHHV